MARQVRFAAAHAGTSSSTFSQQVSVYIMYALIFVCLGYMLQTALSFERYSDDTLVSDLLLRRSDDLLRLSNKPKLWVPFYRDQNRLQQGNYWKSFLDRSTEPDEVQIQFLHLTLRSIERHNAEDFQIVLVDDSTFARLIPKWPLKLEDIERCTSEGTKQHLRRIGLLQLLYLHGGMVIPPSFVCLGPLLPTYEQFTDRGDKPFFAESVCENGQLGPSTRVMGAPPNHFLVRELVEMLVRRHFADAKEDNKLAFPYNYELRMMIDQHFEHSEAFSPFVSRWIWDHAVQNRADGSRDCNVLPGELLCVCTARKPRKLIDIDQWMARSSTRVADDTLAVLERRNDRARAIDFPYDRAVLRRNTRWIAKARVADIMNSHTVLATFLQFSLDDRGLHNDAQILAPG